MYLSRTNKPFAATAARRPAATRALLAAAVNPATGFAAGSKGGNANAGGLG